MGDPVGRRGDAPIAVARSVRYWPKHRNLAFDRHPLQADALEEAMCIAAGILAHCREPDEHVMRM